MDKAIFYVKTKRYSLQFYLLIFGCLLSVCHKFIFAIPTNIQWIFFLGILLLTGIPHGAIDHLVDQKNQINQNKKFTMIQFLVKYVSKMLLYGLIWWYLPVLAVTIFMLISAYHFGETDLNSISKNHKSEKLLFLSYGWVFLSILLFTHKSEVLEILKTLPNYLDGFTNTLILLFDTYKNAYFTFCASLLIYSYYIFQKNSEFSFTSSLFLFGQGVLLLIICSGLPFLLAFGFYFGLWHSLVCLQSIRHYLREKSDSLEWQSLIRQAALFSLMAIAGIVGFILIGNMYQQTSSLLFWLFIAIAVLTAPHMEVMSNMFRTIKAE